MKRILLYLMIVLGVAMMPAGAVMADDGGCGGSFLGLRPWYQGLTDGDCEVKINQGDDVSEKVWKIVMNVLFNLFVVVGYLAIGFIMYGGYTYLLARGDPGKIEKGKKTLVSAISGLIIAVLASAIVSFIGGAILG